MLNPTPKYGGKRGFSQGISGICRISRKQEPQYVPETVGPGLFLVYGTLRLHIRKIESNPPPSLDQQPLQHVRIPEMPRSFRGSHVQPDAQVRSLFLLGYRMQNTAMVPPERRRHHGNLAEHLWMRKAQIK